ncbi:unnamed protein product [Triticum turgidum subsp. durum]|uniref:J domain-containing protein n=1 Tax=Triticum turgidum subsp. durum TaxID=4567 RepID=A0A9R0RJW1_TRITD|nr:unnamed protein product [Triticum turgidum subsp. durum]
MMQSPSQHQSSYYAVLGVHPGASSAEIRAAYHRLAMRWHPDKIANGRVDPAIAEEAKGRFQKIHEAYQVLSDQKRRELYDAGMYDPLDDDQEEVEGFHDFLQEMLSLMATVGREFVRNKDEQGKALSVNVKRGAGFHLPPAAATKQLLQQHQFVDAVRRTQRRSAAAASTPLTRTASGVRQLGMLQPDGFLRLLSTCAICIAVHASVGITGVKTLSCRDWERQGTSSALAMHTAGAGTVHHPLDERNKEDGRYF